MHHLLVILDLDIKNAFPSFEWDSIRAGVEKHAPSVSNWTRWCHAEDNFVILPCGKTVRSNRGAEQGDPLGSLYCGVALIETVEQTRVRMRAALGIESNIFFDAWFMDDGQIVLQPQHVHLFLTIFDEELKKLGAIRGSVPVGGDTSELKSVAKLVGHPDSIAEIGTGWATSYVRSTCRVAANNGDGHVLGVDFGPVGVTTSQFNGCVDDVSNLHTAISNIGDAGSELVLLRRCADVCKMTHLLRAAGQSVAETSLQNFDAQLDRALSMKLGGSLRSEALT